VQGLATILAVVCMLLSGCAGTTDDGADGPPEVGGAIGLPVNATFWLKPEHGLSMEPPARDDPAAVAVPPGQNAYANEDLEAFRSAPVADAMHVTAARVTVHYEVTQPVGNPFVSGSAPDGRLFIFWLGSEGVLPSYGQTFEQAVLVPGEVYQTTVELPMPKGGLYVGGGRSLDLLAIATASQQEDALRILVDSEATPSRIELEGTQVAAEAFPFPAEDLVNQTVTIPANAGLFTGATSGEASEYRRTLAIENGTQYLRVEVRFQETTGPKADLDLWLYDEDGAEVAASTTPFQSETVELWPVQFAGLAPGDYAILVNAYSGADTSFRLRVAAG
jgi:hypothetical protein